MFNKIFGLSALFYFILSLGGLYGLEPKDMIRLRNAGVGDTVTEVIQKEKILETCALSINDIIKLKSNGYSDESISAYLYHISFLKNAIPRTYKNYETANKITQADIEDLAYLKEIGLSDDLIKALISKQTGSHEVERAAQVLKMLEKMGMILEVEAKNHEKNKPPYPH